MPANTKTAEHRPLRFHSFDDLWKEVERIAAADRAGTLRRTGNWTTGQTFNHLATWVGYTVDGFPPQLRPPWFIKLIVGMMKNKYLNGSMPRGISIPKIPGGTLGIEDAPLDQSMLKLRTQWERLLAATSTHASPLFGPLSHEDWIKSHLRHAELHLGFLHP